MLVAALMLFHQCFPHSRNSGESNEISQVCCLLSAVCL